MRKVFLMTLLIAMMSATTVFAANWQQVYTDQNDNEIFFDLDSVKISSMTPNREEATFSAVYRMNYSERGREATIAWYRDYSIVPAGIENLAYDISTICFKREGGKIYYYIASRLSYTANGRNISTMDYYAPADPQWQEIPVASVVDVEYREAALIVDGKKYDANY
ncbi:MAG: hypothetical protein IJ685_00755 [Selenomonadaceae bacterium]|nr:hypothetical protein [Selenomonadaceae bacterium]